MSVETCLNTDDAPRVVRAGRARGHVPRGHGEQKEREAELVPDPRRHLASRASVLPGHRLWYDDPADRAQEPVDPERQAAIALAPFGRAGAVARAPFHHALIEDHANSAVAGEGPLEMLVEVLAIARHDDELPDHLWRLVIRFRLGRALVGALRAACRCGPLQEARERGPRLAPAGRCRLRTAICPAPYKSRATPASGAIRRAMVKRSTRPFLGNIIIPPPWEGDRATIGPNQWNSGKALIQWVFLGVNPSGVEPKG